MLSGQVKKGDASWQIDSVLQTESLWERTRGLLGREALSANQALWIIPCNSIHSVGMVYALDLVYLNKHSRVIKLVQELKPLRASFALRAHSVLELRAGEISRLNINEGDMLRWLPNE